jgi:hypothetical protein
MPDENYHKQKRQLMPGNVTYPASLIKHAQFPPVIGGQRHNYEQTTAEDFDFKVTPVISETDPVIREALLQTYKRINSNLADWSIRYGDCSEQEQIEFINTQKALAARWGINKFGGQTYIGKAIRNHFKPYLNSHRKFTKFPAKWWQRYKKTRRLAEHSGLISVLNSIYHRNIRTSKAQLIEVHSRLGPCIENPELYDYEKNRFQSLFLGDNNFFTWLARDTGLGLRTVKYIVSALVKSGSIPTVGVFIDWDKPGPKPKIYSDGYFYFFQIRFIKQSYISEHARANLFDLFDRLHNYGHRGRKVGHSRRKIIV